MSSNYYELRSWLERFIPYTYSKKNLGLERITYLLKLLGNPQNKFKSILVAGTSGKGSTAFYIAQLLCNCNVQAPLLRQGRSTLRASDSKSFAGRANSKLQINSNKLNSKNNWKLEIGNWKFRPKVGLHLSPHLSYIGERMQIDGKVISVDRLIGLISRIRLIVDEIQRKKPELTPSYFEILVAATFKYFADQRIDVAVVEVGLGGRLDATNVLTPEISVITNVGLDHTEILGETLEKIAYEKAGIIKKNTPVVTAATGKALKVIEKVARQKKAPLIKIDTQLGVEPLNSDMFGYINKYYYLVRSHPDSFASQNKNLALLVVLTLMSLQAERNNLLVRHSGDERSEDSRISSSKNDSGRALWLRSGRSRMTKGSIDREAVKKAFSVGIPGRFQEIERGVILDGAHNADKIKYLIKAVKIHTNYSNNQSEIILVVAFKKGKDWKKMLGLLVKSLPIKKIIATKFYAVTDTGPAPYGVGAGFFAAVEPDEIKDYLKSNSKVKVESFDNSQEAVIRALNAKRSNTNQLILVTGSLYLVGEVRTMWNLPQF